MATMKKMLARVWPPANNVANTSHLSLIDAADDNADYNHKVDEIREIEYPTLTGTTYLDHAGTTPYAKSTIEKWTAELTTNLFGNPHSASAASQLSTRRIDDIRLKVLKFFNASPDDFDIVFVANATAAIKLVAEAFRDNKDGFWYGYHADAHTSLVGCRELAERGWTCFENEEALERWIAYLKHDAGSSDTLQLIAYPGQSNMTGRRLPMQYCRQVRENARNQGRRIYTLLDAASLVSTSPLNLSDAANAPDFTALSFYKIFGFPDLGALIVHKESAQVLMQKRYFAGGTVDAVAHSDGGWHMKKSTVHACSEEGTLPFHNILALDHAMDVHADLFGSMDKVSRHSRYLATEARNFLSKARHANGEPTCKVYHDSADAECGPIVTFNLKDSSGCILSASEIEKLCIVKGIQVRTGGLCNPGGVARHLHLSSDQIKSNYVAGRRCGGDSELIDGKPTGVIRISFGAMSTKTDLQNFISFIQEYYVEGDILRIMKDVNSQPGRSTFVIDSLSVYPIKSCAAFEVPGNQRWQVTPKGLAWDREWCLVHEGTYAALSQKRYPNMALLQPTLDLTNRKLRVSHTAQQPKTSIEIDLDETPSTVASIQTCAKGTFKLQDSKVCGDTVPIHIYSSPIINQFFSKALDVPCCLARYPRDTTHSRNANIRKPNIKAHGEAPIAKHQPQLMLSNESPVLIVSSSSVNELNKQIEKNALQTDRLPIRITASSFRANIVVAQHDPQSPKMPYVEDGWTSLAIRPAATQYPDPLDVPHQARPSRHPSDHSDPSDSQSDHSFNGSLPGSFSTSPSTTNTEPTASSTIGTSNPKTSQPSATMRLDILGPCQRCQMLTINQNTAATQQEPFCTLAKTRRKGDGRVWFGVHASLVTDGKADGGNVWVKVGDLAVPST